MDERGEPTRIFLLGLCNAVLVQCDKLFMHHLPFLVTANICDWRLVNGMFIGTKDFPFFRSCFWWQNSPLISPFFFHHLPGNSLFS